MTPPNPIVRVCSLLNQHGARYFVVGAQACILHGLIRTTEDVDILIQATEDNARRVIAALAELEDHAAAELTPRDLLEKVVVKVADEVEVDVSTHARKVGYEDATGTALSTQLDSVTIPYLDLDTLIASKETYREQDRVDVARLRKLKRLRGQSN
jgi:hypothetical protein